MRTLTILISVACLAAVSGCDRLKPEKSPNYEADIVELRREIDLLKAQQSLAELRKLGQQWSETAYLTPGSTGYDTIKYNLGTLLVTLSDIQPYANGSKGTLLIGNPYFANLSGLKATMSWGKTDDKGEPIEGSEKSKQISFIEMMKAGRWTRVTVILEGSAPADLGYIRLGDLTNESIQLSGP